MLVEAWEATRNPVYAAARAWLPLYLQDKGHPSAAKEDPCLGLAVAVEGLASRPKPQAQHITAAALQLGKLVRAAEAEGGGGGGDSAGAKLRSAMERAIEAMRKRDTHGSFSRPVLELVADQPAVCDRYRQVIKRPMDLSTLMTGVRRGQYRDFDHLEADVRLMRNNSARFNGPQDQYTVHADGLVQCFLADKQVAEKRFGRGKATGTGRGLGSAALRHARCILASPRMARAASILTINALRALS